MKLLIIILILVILAITLCIIYIDAYNKLNTLQIKIKKANDEITNLLEEKWKLMNELYSHIKKIVPKKDYLKEFSNLNKDKLTNNELDKQLNIHLNTMMNFKEDYKKLNTDEVNNIINLLKEKEEKLTANKKFFNTNNNKLMKLLKGQYKIVANFKGIKVKTAFETKQYNFE